MCKTKPMKNIKYGYYYTEDTYQYYIRHTSSKQKIPIPKKNHPYIIPSSTMDKLIKNLNETDSDLIWEYETKMKMLYLHNRITDRLGITRETGRRMFEEWWNCFE